MDEDWLLIPLKGVILEGDLRVPPDARNLVIFAHGSGSGRNSPRNIFVAKKLGKQGIATLLFDLLTEQEDLTYANRFDIPLLTKRLVEVTEWVTDRPELRELPIGYFGASTGAASALQAAAKLGRKVHTVVSRGGRVDLASDVLGMVEAATLLIVGGNDFFTLTANREALAKLRCEKDLQVVKGATHLFEEPGALEKVADLAANWFIRKMDYLCAKA